MFIFILMCYLDSLEVMNDHCVSTAYLIHTVQDWQKLQAKVQGLLENTLLGWDGSSQCHLLGTTMAFAWQNRKTKEMAGNRIRICVILLNIYLENLTLWFWNNRFFPIRDFADFPSNPEFFLHLLDLKIICTKKDENP